MALFRSIETGIWRDTWFSELEPAAKVVFLYGITSDRQTACGAFEVSMRQMAFDTGLAPKELEAALCSLCPKVVWWPEDNILWVRNFYKYQNRGSNTDNFRQGALKAMYGLPQEVNDAIREEYPDLDDVPDQ